MTHPKNWMSQYSQKPQFMRNRKVMERDVEQEVSDTLSERNVDQESGDALKVDEYQDLPMLLGHISKQENLYGVKCEHHI